MLFSLGGGGDISYNEASTTLRESTHGVSRTHASIDAKIYLDQREKRHLGGSVSKEVVSKRLRVFGSDILKDDSFYQDLPKQASKELNKIFVNNTYIAPSSKTAELMKDEERILEPQQSKTLLSLKKQLLAINSVHEHLQTQSRENLKQETEFCFKTHRDKKHKSRRHLRGSGATLETTRTVEAPPPVPEPSKEVIKMTDEQDEVEQAAETALREMSRKESRARSNRLIERLERNVSEIVSNHSSSHPQSRDSKYQRREEHPILLEHSLDTLKEEGSRDEGGLDMTTFGSSVESQVPHHLNGSI